jgi:hypothetical protein
MPSRKQESFSFEAFRIGDEYTRDHIARIAKAAPLRNNREWTGIVEFANCVVLFSTLDKSDLPPEHNYADCFSGDQFKWESQNENTQNTPVIARILSHECPVLLFCRPKAKDQGHAVPFVYVGLVRADTHDGNRPVKVLFDLLNYEEHANPALKQLYDWRPAGGRKLDSLEVPSYGRPLGQGRQMDSRKRRAIEDRAMLVCREQYEGEGFKMTDTSKTHPYDYVAVNETDRRHVEVKGCTGTLSSVSVTSGEIRAAREEGVLTDLFVVHSISVVERTPGVFIAIGGEVVRLTNWKPDDRWLTPTQFDYSVASELRACNSEQKDARSMVAEVGSGSGR